MLPPPLDQPARLNQYSQPPAATYPPASTAATYPASTTATIPASSADTATSVTAAKANTNGSAATTTESEYLREFMNLNKFKLPMLKEKLKEKGLSTSGNKPVLIERLMESAGTTTSSLKGMIYA